MPRNDFLPADVDVVILNYRVGLLAARAARSAHNDGAKSIVIVDNKSEDDSISILQREASDIARIEPLEANVGFSSGNNRGAKYGNKPLILLMNPDVTLKAGALPEMLKIINNHPDVGIVGPSLFWPDGKSQPSAYLFLSPRRILNSLLKLDRVAAGIKWSVFAGNADVSREGDYTGEVESLYGACMLVRRDAFNDVGGFDEDFFLYCEETDLCLRLGRKGWKAWKAGKAEAIHWHGQSAGQVSRTSIVLMSESHCLYARKHFSPFGRLVTAFAFVTGLALRVLFARTFKAKANYFAALGFWLGWTGSADPRTTSSKPGSRQSYPKLAVRKDGLQTALIFHRVGPYHFARARAAGKLMNTTLIEVFKSDDVYGWDPVLGADGFKRVTLFEKNTETTDALVRGIHSALDNCRPDVVAIPGWADAAAFGSLQWCAANGVPAVVMSETTEWDEPRRVWKEWVKRRVLRICAAGLVGGQPHADYLVRLGIPRPRIFQGYDAVDNDYFSRKAQEARSQKTEMRKKYGLPANYFLASARFVPKKNLLNLIQAYARYRNLAEKRPGPSPNELWSLVLLGDGPLKSEIDSLVSNLGLQKAIMLPGFKQYDELPAFYALANVFIHASTVEQWGLVVNEAMASGLPVLVSNRCGCAQDLVKDGVNGFTFDPYSIEQITDLMFRLSNPQFPIADFGAASSRIIADWSPDRFASSLGMAVEAALTVRSRRSGWFDDMLLQALSRKKSS